MHRSVLTMVTMVLLVCALGCQGVPARAGQFTLVLKNWVDRDWPRTLLNYDLDLPPGEFFAGKMDLVGAGPPIPHQVVVIERNRDESIKRCRLSFYTALRKDEELTFRLLSTDHPASTPPQVSATVKGPELELTSATAGVRLPAPGVHNFPEPVVPTAVPAPLLAFRLSDGTWAGQGWLESESKIAGYTQAVVADGPLYKEYAYEVRFAPQGYYRARVRLEAEQPVVHLAEEYDMGRATAGRDFFVLALNQGWKPDTALWTSYNQPEGSTVVQGRTTRGDDVGLFSQPLDFAVDREQQRFYPARDYETKAQYYGLFGSTGGADSPYVGLTSQHLGAWRLPDGSLSPFVWTKSGQVLAKLRLSMNTQGTPMNPFSTAQIDPDLPQTLGRRMWLLALGPRPAPDEKTGLEVGRLDQYRNYDGFLNLDGYKDWILSWPEQDLPRPRVYTTPEALARLRANLDRCPGRDAIKDYYLITGDAGTAGADATRLLRELDNRFRDASINYNPFFRQIQPDEGPIFFADSCLSCKSLAPELREKIRAKCAAVWYMTKDPDYYWRGSGVHLGNPNMTFNRSMGIPMWATLLQDHPQAKAVLDDMAGFTKWLSGYNITAAGGVFRDSTHYSTYGPALFMTKAAIALRNAGYDLDRYSVFQELGDYFLGIESPPALLRASTMPPQMRAMKARHLPAFGNSRDVPASQTELQLACLTAKSDPAYAAKMMGAFGEAGSYLGTGDAPSEAFNWFYWDPAITPQRPVRTDEMITGFGGVLRAHSDDPEETYVALRQGYVQSHWASDQGADQGTFVLYARGANLCPGTGWIYSRVPEGFCHDSRLSFGQPYVASPFGFVDTNIEDYGFLPSVGYLLGRQGFKQRLDKTGTYPGDFTWSRQVMLLRSAQVDGPNYVVMRDTTQGLAPQSWWFQWIQAKASDVTAIPGGVHAEATQGVKLDITFVEPAGAQVTIKGAKVPSFDEDYTQISVGQPANQGYHAVFYPHKQGEPTPRIERLAEGLISVVTSEATDYVFCGVDRPVVFKDDLVDINAYAGAVRVFRDRVLLVNASGQTGRVGYKGVTAQGIGPFERRVEVTPAKSEVINAGRAPAAVRPPPGPGKLIAVDGSTRPADPYASSTGLKGWVYVEGDRTTYVATEGLGQMGYRDFYVRGEAPFTCVHQPGKVTITTDGRRRIFQMPIPEDIVPAKLLPPHAALPEEARREWINWPWAVETKVDGVSRQGGWYDGLMAIGSPDGKHTIEIGPYTNPPVWRENAYTRLLPHGTR